MDSKLFATLQLPTTAGLADVRAAYRRLAARYHPDVCGHSPACVARFQAIANAHEKLTEALSAPQSHYASHAHSAPHAHKTEKDQSEIWPSNLPPDLPPNFWPEHATAQASHWAKPQSASLLDDTVDDLLNMVDEITTSAFDVFSLRTKSGQAS